MKYTIAKLLSGLTNLKTLTVVMFVILSILVMNNALPNDNTIFYITLYSSFSLFYIHSNLINNFQINKRLC